jgi:hypothetical protein
MPARLDLRVDDGGRQCTVCRQYQSWESFGPRKASVTGKKSECNACCVLRSISKSSELYDQVLEGYGAFCACCGEREKSFLVIDHVNNDGAAHRRELQSRGIYPGPAFYRWVVTNGFPDILQVLCANCNTSKLRYKGVCVHKLGEA